MGSHTWALRFLGISEIYYGLILNGPIFQHLQNRWMLVQQIKTGRVKKREYPNTLVLAINLTICRSDKME
jgi:hypothetical protein